MKLIQNKKQFDVALSFAGEDRKYVEHVADTLRKMGIRVFYDKYERITLWGKNLFEYFIDIYQNKARFTVIFCSKHYAEKLWTNHERKAAQVKAFESSQEYILPARFDDSEIPGILNTVGYINLSEYSPEEFAEIVKEKVGPIIRKEFFPEDPDYLYKVIDAKTKKQKELAFNCAMHFFKTLKLMTPEERWLLAVAIANTCPAGPPNNIHLNIEYLSRLTELSPNEIISKFERLDCLGIFTKIRKEPLKTDNICKKIETIYIEYKPLAENCPYNATKIVIGIIDIIFNSYCPEHRRKILNILDLSILSNLAGFSENMKEKIEKRQQPLNMASEFSGKFIGVEIIEKAKEMELIPKSIKIYDEKKYIYLEIGRKINPEDMNILLLVAKNYGWELIIGGGRDDGSPF